MIDQELSRVISEAKNGEYVSQNGAFLEMLRVFAVNEQIGRLSEAAKIYTDQLPISKCFILGRLPAIILNSYLIYKVNVRTEILYDWLCRNDSWAKDIENSALDPGKLVLTISNILTSVSSHTVA